MLSVCIQYEHQIRQRWHERILAHCTSPFASQRICFNLCLSQINDSVSLHENRGGTLFYLLKSIHSRPIKWEFKNSILTSSDWLLSCHKSGYLHPRWTRHANVKVINNSRQLLEEKREEQKLKLLRSEYTEERGKMQFILEWVLTLVVIFFYSCSMLAVVYMNYLYPEGFPSEGSSQTERKK